MKPLVARVLAAGAVLAAITVVAAYILRWRERDMSFAGLDLGLEASLGERVAFLMFWILLPTLGVGSVIARPGGRAQLMATAGAVPLLVAGFLQGLALDPIGSWLITPGALALLAGVFAGNERVGPQLVRLAAGSVVGGCTSVTLLLLGGRLT